MHHCTVACSDGSGDFIRTRVSAGGTLGVFGSKPSFFLSNCRDFFIASFPRRFYLIRPLFLLRRKGSVPIGMPMSDVVVSAATHVIVFIDAIRAKGCALHILFGRMWPTMKLSSI
jgi:hypothetical protein